MTRPPILSPTDLDSASTSMIDRQILYEIRHLLGRLDITQAAFASDIGYGEGTISKWKSGQQRLSEGGARSIDDGGYGVTTIGLTFSALLRAYRASARCGPGDEARVRWDVFLSMPMAAIAGEYQSSVAEGREVHAALQAHCGWRVFFAGIDIPTVNDFDAADVALRNNCAALRDAATFAMLIIQPVGRASSVFVEAGFALALNKPSVYFVRDRQVLPYILREASATSTAGRPSIRVCEVDDLAQVIGLIKRHQADLFSTP